MIIVLLCCTEACIIFFPRFFSLSLIPPVPLLALFISFLDFSCQEFSSHLMSFAQHSFSYHSFLS